MPGKEQAGVVDVDGVDQMDPCEVIVACYSSLDVGEDTGRFLNALNSLDKLAALTRRESTPRMLLVWFFFGSFFPCVDTYHSCLTLTLFALHDPLKFL